MIVDEAHISTLAVHPEWRGRGLGELLRDGMEEALLYRELATLRTDVPLGEKLADLEWRGADRSTLPELAARIGAENMTAMFAHPCNIAVAWL